MKRSLSLPLLLALAIGLTGCKTNSSSPISVSSDSGKITTEKAQRALDNWISSAGSGQVSIVGGVRELPTENAATAELKLSNFNYQSTQTKQYRTYSGSGTATFVHYTDGRWVLNKVLIGDAMRNTSWTPSIEIR